MPDTATRTPEQRVDHMLATIRDLQLHLAAEQSEHQQAHARLMAARRTADREWDRQDDEIRRLRAELDTRRCPVTRARHIARQAAGAVGIHTGAQAVIAGIKPAGT
jgi:hypothetical protein